MRPPLAWWWGWGRLGLGIRGHRRGELGHKFFFKLDYYDSAMEFGSEDPADPSKTTRVLTIMLAQEY
jgi:hypothetical protein